MRFFGLGGRLTRRVCGSRIFVDVDNHFHLFANDACQLQIPNRGFRIRVAIKNSDDRVLHG